MKKRTLEPIIDKISKSFPVLLITGPRQVGKTTLLEICKEKGRKYVSLDDFSNRKLAQEDPALFLQKNPPPIIIDEVQYAPKLFTYIKIEVDRLKKQGLFWLTGSQKFHLMQGISESLAGRVAIIDMLGLSQREINNQSKSSYPFLATNNWLNNASNIIGQTKNIMDIYKDIWLGSYPQMLANQDISRDLFYSSYIQTYIQRDVKDILNITDILAFNKFMIALAARTGQVLNFSDIARDVDIDHKTAKAWLSVLETSGLVYILQPYYRNITKRIIKTPKVYFLDTGLCSYLTNWSSPESLESGAMSGSILETYIFVEILKSYWHNAKSPYFYYYRDTDQKEIDLVIEDSDTLYPVEFKKTAIPSLTAAKNFSVLEKLGRKIGHGAVICLRTEDIPLSQRITAIPVGYI